MQRGRKKRSANELIADGSEYAKNHPDAKPNELTGKPAAPAYLSDVQTQLFNSVVSILDELGTLNRADVNAISRYVVFNLQWQQAVKDNDAKLCLRLHDALHRLETAFGLSPYARTRIIVKPKEITDEKDRFFS